LYEAKLYPNFTQTFPVPSFTLYTFLPSEPTEAFKGKGKSIAVLSRQKADLNDRLSVNQIGSFFLT
jgi:hypothetical protein